MSTGMVRSPSIFQGTCSSSFEDYCLGYFLRGMVQFIARYQVRSSVIEL